MGGTRSASGPATADPPRRGAGPSQPPRGRRPDTRRPSSIPSVDGLHPLGDGAFAENVHARGVVDHATGRLVQGVQDHRPGHIASLDENDVAKFVRVHAGERLEAGEHLLFYRNRGGLRLGAESFLFQEGDAGLYAKARYGELKVDEAGASVLVGLRGDDLKPLVKR